MELTDNPQYTQNIRPRTVYEAEGDRTSESCIMSLIEEKSRDTLRKLLIERSLPLAGVYHQVHFD